MRVLYILLATVLTAHAQKKKFLVSYKPKQKSAKGFRKLLEDTSINAQKVGKNVNKDDKTVKELENDPDVANVEENITVQVPKNKVISFSQVPESLKAGTGLPDSLDMDSIIVNAVKSSPLKFEQDYKKWKKQRYAPWQLSRISSIGSNSQNYFPFGQEYYYPEMPNEVIAYVLDSGVDPTLIELAGRVRLGANFVEGEQHYDYVGHGTAISGLIAGTNNGVAKKAKIVSVKVLNHSNKGSLDSFIQGLEWVAKDKLETYPNTPAILNFSINLNKQSELLQEAFRKVYASGIITTASAGNYASDACGYTPTEYKETITVGSFTPQKNMFDKDISNFGKCVDILAPGTYLFVPIANSGNLISIQSGTSLASGVVCGVGALLLSNHPKLNPEEVKNILLDASVTGQIIGVPENTTDKAVFNGYLGSASTFEFN
ncbi:hypothetical protein BB561_001227 [Smittium simulii]|uniref:Peptidase S8/S53 domain-containing protein n=1 Tax=Smittium simulii TaxID=133385 RepID=A0A2T9YVM8_9FUNG|nr:hypothetical protein BB561_001227 [Smittium simulii]